jgi:Trypsin
MPFRHIASRAGVSLAVWLAASPGALGAEPPQHLPAPIFNGVETTGYPAVGLYTLPEVECTATLIGCRTVLTAAHCSCIDFSADPPRPLFGDACRERPDLLAPEGKRVFFQNAGLFGVSEVVLHPLWDAPDDPGHDLAILRLDRPVEGIRPAAIDRAMTPAEGTEVRLVGFGRTERDLLNQSIKRTGVTTIIPSTSCPDGRICTEIGEPLAPPGEETSICFGDSGGPTFADLGDGLVVAGVHELALSQTCLPPARTWSTDVYQNRQWIEETAGADFGPRTCGSSPQLPDDPDARSEGTAGRLSPEDPEARFDFQVRPGTGVLRVVLNGEGNVRPALNDFDLFAGPAPLATPPASAPCAGASAESLESCEVLAPPPGPWSILVRRVRGEGEFQLVITQLGSPPPGEWLESPDLPGFQVRARFGDAAEVPGERVTDCIDESICVSGALPDRPELFVKVIGPRPNGYLWVQVSRFTPSRAEI